MGDLVDSLQIFKYPTNQLFGQLRSNDKLEINVDKPTLAIVKTQQSELEKMLILVPGEDKILKVDSSGIYSEGAADSLLSYLSVSTNTTIGQNYGVIGEGNHQGVLTLFDSLLGVRTRLIKKSKLETSVERLLLHQNKTRVFNFLFYYGRLMQGIPTDHSFFAFADSINFNDPLFKYAPHLFLYKLEIDYLNRHETISSVLDFATYISKSTLHEDMGAFLKAFYLKELLESPQYWEKHQQVFNSIELKKLLKKEKNNAYAYLFKSGSKSYFSALAGEPAHHFDALKPDSSIVNSNHYDGKLLVIDAWATWCGPCLQQKPSYNTIAAKYKNDNRIKFLSVSTDMNFNKWKNFILKKKSPLEELNVSGTLNSKFQQAYNVQSIPRYIMISADGKIIDADMPDPSIAMERMIDEQLKKGL